MNDDGGIAAVIEKEAEDAKEEMLVDCTGMDFSIPASEGLTSQLADQLYSALLESHVMRLNAAANKSINEAEYKKCKDRHLVCQRLAAGIMRTHSEVRGRMEERIKEADEQMAEQRTKLKTGS